jgi:hypothetical protein
MDAMYHEHEGAQKGAAMDQNLMNLRQRMVKASIEFIRAQRAYLQATAPNSRAAQPELNEATEEYLRAAEPYDASLQDLREYLLEVEPSETIAVELDHTERFIKALDKEKKVCLRRIRKTKAGH